jgi:hypothetical protein
MHPTNRTARIAGLLYVFTGITGAFNLMYVPNTLIVPGNATATGHNILASEMLFRLGSVSALISGTAFILLVWTLYRLLNGVSQKHALLMVSLVLVSVAITFLNEVNNIAALTLFRGPDFLAVFDKPQRDALAMLFLRLHDYGNFVNEILWGLWLFPFGVLVMRSRFLPRILGVLLIVNCFAYVAASLIALLLPIYANVVFRAILPALLGEAWIMLWLLIKGVKVQPLAAVAS